LTGTAQSRCALDAYATRVVDRAKLAIAAAKPLRGAPIVAMNSYFMTDVATNAVLIAGSYGGYAIGAPIYRAVNPPWYSASLLGAPSYTGRIGGILISGGPGEMYPQIVAKVRALVPGMHGYINVGTAGDFLGYIVSPFKAYPEPIRQSFFSGDAPPAGDPDCGGGIPSPIGCPSPVDNDNYFFNVSHTFGERLTCSLLRGAGDIVAGDKHAYWAKYSRCAAFADDYVRRPNFDTRFPSQPDLSTVLTH
jgi:hypothetical protein